MFSENYSVLVVDDLADNLLWLQAGLEAEGYSVETATSGSAALDKLHTSPADLVLLDVMMPEMNGYEVTQAIRQDKQLRSIPVLLLTADREESRGRGLAVGADELVHKPIDFEELFLKIRGLCRLGVTKASLVSR